MCALKLKSLAFIYIGNKKKMKIRNKLLLNFLSISIFIILVIMIDSFYNVDTVILKDAKDKLEAIATIQESRVEAEISNYKTQVSQIASRTSLTDDIVSYNKSPNKSVRDMLNIRAQDIRSSVSDYEGVFILDKNGETITSSGRDNVEQYIDKSKFKKLKTGKFVFVSNKKELSMDLIITGPVNNNGEFEGLIVVITHASGIKKIVTDYTGLGETGETTIVYRNQNGDAAFLEPPRFINDDINLIVSKDNFDAAATQALLKKEILLKDSIDYAGNRIYAETRYIFDADWGVVAKVNKAELFAPIFDHAKQLGLIGILVLIATILAALKIANNVSAPLEILQNGANDVESGNFSTRVRINSRDEFGILATSFNNMISAVVASRADVDRKVFEQTKEIKEKSEDMYDQQRAIVNILEDVEEERQEAINEMNKIDTIIESIGDGVFVVDPYGKIILFNKSATDISGYKKDEVVGKHYHDILKFYHEDDNIDASEFIEESIKTGSTTSMSPDTILVTKTKERVPVADSAAPFLNNSNKINGCVIVFRDVTKERRIDKAKTEFVSLASHQLRTPLSAINWYAEMLTDGDAGKLSDEQLKYVKEIYDGNQRMVALVNSLLNVSRLELGIFAVDPEPIVFVDISKSVISELVPQIKTKKLVIEEDYQKSIPVIDADPKLVRIIFQNLLSNAVKYTPEKGTVGIKVSIDEKNINIEIYDTGYGIPKSQQDQIFTKLFRADNVREKDTEGTGLGLYLVKSIVENAEGKVWFKSAENKGTHFFVTLPLTGMKKKEGTKELEATS